MNSIFDDLDKHWPWRRPGGQSGTAPAPATAPTPTGGHVKLAALTQDTISAFDDGTAWIKHTAEVKLPALMAEVQRLQASPIIQALEGVTLTPAAEQAIAAVVAELAALSGHNTMANPAEEAALAAGPAEHVA